MHNLYIMHYMLIYGKNKKINDWNIREGRVQTSNKVQFRKGFIQILLARHYKTTCPPSHQKIWAKQELAVFKPFDINIRNGQIRKPLYSTHKSLQLLSSLWFYIYTWRSKRMKSADDIIPNNSVLSWVSITLFYSVLSPILTLSYHPGSKTSILQVRDIIIQG